MEIHWEVAPFYSVPKMGVAPTKEVAELGLTLQEFEKLLCWFFLPNYCFIFARVASITYLAAYSGISTWLHYVRFIYLKSSSQISGLFTNLGCFLANPFGAQNSKASQNLVPLIPSTSLRLQLYKLHETGPIRSCLSTDTSKRSVGR